jgi:hypothetical protein
MMLLAKLALGFTGTFAMATVYTFRDGVVNVEVEQHGADGTNVHVWAPAAVVPMVLHFVPDQKLGEAHEKIAEFMPTIRALTKELKKLPDAELVDVRDGKDHVRVSVHNGKVIVDVKNPEERVHVACPLAMIGDVTSELASRTPGV